MDNSQKLNMADIDKLIQLAFHPSAVEGEAINAFLALRRHPDIATHINDICVPKPLDKHKRVWSLTVPAKSFDAVFRAISEYKNEPYFILKPKQHRNTITDAWYLELTVYFKSNDEFNIYSRWLETLFARLRA